MPPSFPLLFIAAFRHFNVVSWRPFHSLGNQQLEHVSESAPTLFFTVFILVDLAPWFTPQLESMYYYTFHYDSKGPVNAGAERRRGAGGSG